MCKKKIRQLSIDELESMTLKLLSDVASWINTSKSMREDLSFIDSEEKFLEYFMKMSSNEINAFNFRRTSFMDHNIKCCYADFRNQINWSE